MIIFLLRIENKFLISGNINLSNFLILECITVFFFSGWSKNFPFPIIAHKSGYLERGQYMCLIYIKCNHSSDFLTIKMSPGQNQFGCKEYSPQPSLSSKSWESQDLISLLVLGRFCSPGSLRAFKEISTSLKMSPPRLKYERVVDSQAWQQENMQP